MIDSWKEKLLFRTEPMGQKNSGTSNSGSACLFQARWFYTILLTALLLLCLWLTVPSGCLFGSEGDWFSQHTVLAEQFRRIFYETGQIFPDYTQLGSGSNIYDISYYGFLRPDVLISFLLPAVPMAYIISGYAVLSMLAAVLLCFFWLCSKTPQPFFAFLGAFLCGCAACFFHAHHQIMFVNYLPFLFLALMALDRFLASRRAGLLIFSLFLVYLHSFYFSVSVLFVCLIYLVHQSSLLGIRFGSPAFFRSIRGFAVSVLISIGLACILLVPTGIDLLSNRKDTGGATALSELLSGSLSLESLLYSRYSCGLTLICLYTLLLSIRRKKTRLLSLLLLLCLTLNIVPYVLSGFLYIRYKVLIPLIPLILLLCVQTLEELHQKKIRYSIPILFCCLIPLVSTEVPALLLLDFALILLTLVLCRFWKNRMPAVCFLILCFLPASVTLYINQEETWISASDNRQAVFSQKELSRLSLDTDYRFANLTDPFANANVTPMNGMGTVNLYSSITNSFYSDYFHHTARNPIRIRNRVALMTDANPVFSYLMGIRYIQARDGQLPAGYHVIARKGNNVLAENTCVLPKAYTSANLMKEQDYKELDFPKSLTALTQYTVVPDSKVSGSGGDSQTAQDGREHTGDRRSLADTVCPAQTELKIFRQFFQALSDPNAQTGTGSSTAPGQVDGTAPGQVDSTAPDQDYSTAPGQVDSTAASGRFSFSLKKETALTLPLSLEKDRLLILSFAVSAADGDELTITFHGVRNKLSGKNAPYPNLNNTFMYLISSSHDLEEISCVLSAGDFEISNLQVCTADLSLLKNSTVTPFASDKEKGHAILKGTAALEESGYFVTSYPYRKGYQAYVDGEPISIQNINQGFVGFPLTEGSHEITLFYSPPGKKAGAFLSLLSFIIYIILLEKRKCVL